MDTWQRLNGLEAGLIHWLARYSIGILRVNLGIVYFWFGVLKFFPDTSPAQDLVARTCNALTLGMVNGQVSLPVLGTWECAIGLGLITGRCLRITLLLQVVQMLGTFTPLVLFTQEAFHQIPFVLTLEGEFIVKNLVLLSAGLVIVGALPRPSPPTTANAKVDGLKGPLALRIGPPRVVSPDDTGNAFDSQRDYLFIRPQGLASSTDNGTVQTTACTEEPGTLVPDERIA